MYEIDPCKAKHEAAKQKDYSTGQQTAYFQKEPKVEPVYSHPTSKDFHVSIINKSITTEEIPEDPREEYSISKKTINNLETKQSEVLESPITHMQIN